jgi:hypothetical protein
MMKIQCLATGVLMAVAAPAVLAQHATVSAPSAYRTQFDNDFVRVVRVHYGPNERVAEHEHASSNTVYVYLNASGPVQFRHIKGATHVANRQPTVAGTFRVSRGGNETHEVVNMSATPSDFIRLELKTDPAGEAPFFREPAPTAPPADNAADVKYTNRQIRVTRLAVAPGKTMALSSAANEPALLVALKNGTLSGLIPNGAAVTAGQERWVAAGEQVSLTNSGSAPVELLRMDLLTAPHR